MENEEMETSEAVEILDGLVKGYRNYSHHSAYEAIDSICKNTDDIKKIKIKYYDDAVTRINRICTDHWITLRAFDSVTLDAGQTEWIPLGVSMILPKDYEAHIIIPNTVFNDFGIWLPNGMEVIEDTDNDQWMLYVRAMRDTIIPEDEPICQFRIMKSQPALIFEESYS